MYELGQKLIINGDITATITYVHEDYIHFAIVHRKKASQFSAKIRDIVVHPHNTGYISVCPAKINKQ